MAELPTNVLYYGKEDPLPETRPLRAGPLSLLFEAGDLRYIRLGEKEILRRVYVAVRDRNWGTILPNLSNLNITEDLDSFQITFEVEHKEREIDFFWRGTITGDSSGTITFKMDGEARATFMRNRIGFCVLHPPRECAGAPVKVEKPDGSIEEGQFPEVISPHQPFFDIQAISHQIEPGLWVKVAFTGDVFEMEDQRNWTDASYKTYCTPLSLGYPVEIRSGEKVAQSVTLTLEGNIPVAPSDLNGPIRFTFQTESPLPLPEIGLGVASHGEPLSQQEQDRLSTLNLSHLRVDLRFSQEDAYPKLLHAVQQAQSLDLSLEVALHLSDRAEEELNGLLPIFHEWDPPVSSWIILKEGEKTTPESVIRGACEILYSVDPSAKIGAGTDADFVDLNRFRPPVEAADFIAYPMNPQVHAFDNASLVETLEAQAATVRSAQQFAGGKPIYITPVTLQRRFNPDATGPVPEPLPGELPSPVDERQMSLFGAGWTLGSLKYLCESGVKSVTYFETTGWRGVMETEKGSSHPEKFRSISGSVFPLYHVLAELGEFTGGEVLKSRSGDPLKVEGIVLRELGRIRLLLANLSPEPQEVTIAGLSGSVNLYRMDESNVMEAMASPDEFRRQSGETQNVTDGEWTISLPPYGLIRVDGAAS